MLKPLWKFVEKAGGTEGTGGSDGGDSRRMHCDQNARDQAGMQMCSACRGDYENPDAAMTDEIDEPEDTDEGGKPANERFPG